jgi:PPOX class probable F420-dependent enzyme
LSPEEVKKRFAASRVARLATADGGGLPHIVPIVFALEGDRLFSAVDHKPKRTVALRRLDNIASNPQVAVLVDQFSEQWDQLWWARADGLAAVLDPESSEGGRGLDLLVSRYPQYSGRRPVGPVISISVRRWSGWSAAD